MGILSNTVSFSQYRLMGEVPAENRFEWASECLRKNAFRSIEAGGEELSVGWVHVDDSREANFESPQSFWRDRYLVFTLRRDQRKVPGALLRAHLRLAEQRFLNENPGLKRVPKQKKEELREVVQGSLLARTLPIPATYDVVWDLEGGLITVASLSPKVMELFEAVFRRTFEGLRPVVLHPYGRASQVVADDLKPGLEKANGAGSEAVLDLIDGNRWIGQDFLLWLLHRTVSSNSEYGVNRPGTAVEGERFVAYLNDRFVLQGGDDNGPQKVTIAGPQSSFEEVRATLATGKQFGEAVIYLEKAELEWRFLLKGATFQFGSFRSPRVTLERDSITDEASEKEAAFHERMHVVEEGLQLFDSLLATFLAERLQEGWIQTEGAARSWIGGE